VNGQNAPAAVCVNGSDDSQNKPLAVNSNDFADSKKAPSRLVTQRWVGLKGAGLSTFETKHAPQRSEEHSESQ